MSGSQTAPMCTGPLASSPFMSTWFSNRSSDRVTQRTSMLESTSELLICFRNTWNWSRDGAHWQGLLARAPPISYPTSTTLQTGHTEGPAKIL